MKTDQAFGKVQLQSGNVRLSRPSKRDQCRPSTSNNDSYRDGRRVRDEDSIQLKKSYMKWFREVTKHSHTSHAISNDIKSMFAPERPRSAAIRRSRGRAKIKWDGRPQNNAS